MSNIVSIPRRIYDSYRNFLAGLGYLGKDKAASATYFYEAMDITELEAAYRSDWIARKAIDIPAFDATRAWRSWQAEDDQITSIEETEKRLNLRGKVREAMTVARLYGGAAIIIGTTDGDFSSELDPTKVGKDGLKFLHVISRWDLSEGDMEYDITSPYYGMAKYYERKIQATALKTNNFRVHPSRIVKFIGHEVPDAINKGEFWGDPVLQSVRQAMLAAATVSNSIATLITEAKVDIYKIKDMSTALSTEEGSSQLLARFSHVNSMKSIANAVVMDKDEELNRVTVNFAGMPEVLQMYLLIACGAVDVPATRFLGQSPAGMNSTGESDSRNYYDRLHSEQEMKITPTMYSLDEIVIRSSLGSRPPEIFYNWNSLWQLDDVQKSALAKTKAETAKIDADTGLIPESALAKGRQNQLIEDGTYPGLETAIQEAEVAGENSPHDPAFQIEQQAKTAESEAAAAAALANPQPDPTAVPGQPSPPARGKLKLVKSGDSWTEDATTPRPLYVRRDLLNFDEVAKWARGEGLELQDDAHVTILYSKTPVDWMKMGADNEWNDKSEIVIPAGGPRVVERLGDEGAIVLHFVSSRLAWHHEDMVRNGASHDYDEYAPHLTITYKTPADFNIEAVKPYNGPLVFGPEIFEEIK